MLVEDHGVMRDGLRILIESQKDMAVVGEVADGTSAVREICASDCDVVLLDLSLPGLDGISVLRELKRELKCARVVVLTMHDQRSYARRALDAGAAGYVVKAAASCRVIAAIRAVHEGQTFVDVDLGDQAEGENELMPSAAMVASLSPRELEVLGFVAAGHTNRETSEKLELSEKTVEGYRRRLARKLDARSRADLVRVALRMGLLTDGT
jgi:two-component system response regulator NreC